MALVNNAQREHQEFMASVEATAEENGAVFAALGPSGVAVFPADDPCAPIWWRLAGSRPHLTFALHGEADLTADAEWSLSGVGHWAMHLHTPPASCPLPAGARCAQPAQRAGGRRLRAGGGAPLAAIQQGWKPSAPPRAARRSAWSSRTTATRPRALIDDSYNANPDSMRAAVELLAVMRGPRWFLMGDMGEVGAQGPAFHAEIGQLVRERGIEQFWCAGALSTARGCGLWPGRPPLRYHRATRRRAPAGPDANSLLVKGSRFMAMERAVSFFKEAA